MGDVNKEIIMIIEEVTKISPGVYVVFTKLEPRQGRELYVEVVGEFERAAYCQCTPHDPNCQHESREEDFVPERYFLYYADGVTAVECRNNLITDMIVDGKIAEAIQKHGEEYGF